MPIELMGKFTAVGMRTKIDDPNGIAISTCSDNDKALRGDPQRWSWSNPTNTALVHQYEDVKAVSTETLWQGTKLLPGQTEPDVDILCGKWRKNKGKRPAGAYAGPGRALITDPGQARRRIYIPAFKRQIDHWIRSDDEVADWVQQAMAWDGRVYLRDYDTGRGIDRNGPVSHAWILAVRLNTGKWPGE